MVMVVAVSSKGTRVSSTDEAAGSLVAYGVPVCVSTHKGQPH
jgi:hypothetical protein